MELVAANRSDFFGLFGLPASFALDIDELEKRYRLRSKDVHPDRFAAAPAADRVRALQQTMDLNEAFSVLKRPARRAEYLLKCHGIRIGDNDSVAPELIMEMLEAREELAAAIASGDRARVEELEDAMLARKQSLLASVEDLFAKIEVGGGDGAALLDQVKTELIRLRYVDRYLEQIDDADDLEEL